MNAALCFGSLALLGLAGTPHCAAMCGPLALWASAGAHGREAWTRALLQALARALGYALLGFAAALVWRRIGTAGSAWRHAQLAAAALLALVLACAALRALAPGAALARVPRVVESAVASAGAALRALGPRRGAFGSGVLNACLPCGLSWSALALASQAAPLVALGASACFGALTAIGPLAVLGGQRWLAARAGGASRRLAASALMIGAALCAWRGYAAWRVQPAPCCVEHASTTAATTAP